MNVVDDDADTEIYQQETPNYHYFYKSGKSGGRKGKNKGGPFREDLRRLMFGFGDNEFPNEGSLDLLEIYVEEFIVNLVVRTARRSIRAR
jgi:hypothetical protein